MKKLLLLLILVLMLPGCQSMYPSDYRYVQEHDAPYAYRETEPATEPTRSREGRRPLVSSGADLREAIQEMVDNGIEAETFLLKDYSGDVDLDMKNMYNEMLIDSPKYNYAMDSPPFWHLSPNEEDEGELVTIRIKLRIKPEEIRDIFTRRYDVAMQEICEQVIQLSSTYTVQISGYEDTDYNALLERFFLEYPNEIMEIPDITTVVFPNRGSIRVLEIRFVYLKDRDILQRQRQELNQLLAVLQNQLSDEMPPAEIVDVLYKLLLPAAGYKDDPKATVYAQVVQKKAGNSRCMAAVVAYLCKGVNADCEIVVGQRNDMPWYWNRILTDEGWKYFDLHGAALDQIPPTLVSKSEFSDYTWDSNLYPELPQSSQPLPQPEGPTDPEQTREPAQTDPPSDPEPEEPTASTESSTP